MFTAAVITSITLVTSFGLRAYFNRIDCAEAQAFGKSGPHDG